MNYYLHGSLFPYTFTHLIFFIESVKPQNIMTPKSVSVFINVIKKKDLGKSAIWNLLTIYWYMSEAAFIIYLHLKNITFECTINLSRCTLMIEWIILVQIRIYYTKTTYLWQITVNSAKSICWGFAIMLRNHVKNIFCL